MRTSWSLGKLFRAAALAVLALSATALGSIPGNQSAVEPTDLPPIARAPAPAPSATGAPVSAPTNAPAPSSNVPSAIPCPTKPVAMSCTCTCDIPQCDSKPVIVHRPPPPKQHPPPPRASPPPPVPPSPPPPSPKNSPPPPQPPSPSPLPPSPSESPSSAPSPAPSPDRPRVPSLFRHALDQHNMYRERHGAAPLVWNKTLAKGAKAWAEQCVFEHDNQTEAGENLYAAWGVSDLSPSYIAKEAVDSWYEEATKNYDFANPEINGDTGHFTQVVWKKTRSLGCAQSVCDNDTMNLVVCRYWPPGNDIDALDKNVMKPVS